MKIIALLISTINVYLGLRYFLNAIHVLNSSKYSQTATVIFAILFLGMGIAGFYFSLVNNKQQLAVLVGIGPWFIALFILLFNMLTGDYK